MRVLEGSGRSNPYPSWEKKVIAKLKRSLCSGVNHVYTYCSYSCKRAALRQQNSMQETSCNPQQIQAYELIKGKTETKQNAPEMGRNRLWISSLYTQHARSTLTVTHLCQIRCDASPLPSWHKRHGGTSQSHGAREVSRCTAGCSGPRS